MNRFAFGDAHEYDAIVDRAQFIYFDPTPLEIHKNAALWFWDQEVFDFVGEHLHVIDPDKLSSRAYVKAYERKPKGDWKEFIARRYFTQSGEQWVVALESDPKYKSVDERVAEFVKRTGLGRSTYFNFKKALKADGQLSSPRRAAVHADGQAARRPGPGGRSEGGGGRGTPPCRAEAARTSRRNRSIGTWKTSTSTDDEDDGDANANADD